jgi:hypothetical protein
MHLEMAAGEIQSFLREDLAQGVLRGPQQQMLRTLIRLNTGVSGCGCIGVHGGAGFPLAS